jgi:hypothetical protein
MVCRANTDTVCTVTLATYPLTPVWEFRGFHSSVVEDSVLLGYDADSLLHTSEYKAMQSFENSGTDHPVTQRHISEKRNPEFFMDWATFYISEAFLLDTSFRTPVYTIRWFPGIKQPEG